MVRMTHGCRTAPRRARRCGGPMVTVNAGNLSEVGLPGTVAPDSRRWVVLGVLCLALLVVGIDGTIVNVALPTLGARARRDVEPAAVDRRRLHDRLRQLPAHRRQHRRPARAASACFVVGLVDLRRRVARLLARRLRRRADRPARRAGLRRRVHHAGDAVDPHQRLHRRAASGPGRSRSGPACRGSAWPSARSPAASCSSTSGGVRSSSSTCRSSSSRSSPCSLLVPELTRRARAPASTSSARCCRPSG